MTARRRAPAASGDSPASRFLRRHWTWLLFAAALAIRLLAWQATPDSGWAYSALYKGDAPVWLDYARALAAGQPFELGLPLRPPGTGYLVSLGWDGGDAAIGRLRLLWCLLGALAVKLFADAARSAFGESAHLAFGEARAVVAGLLMAGSTAMILLAISVNSEAPYLVLVGALLLLWPRTVAGRRPALVASGLLHAVACLFRAEHLLFTLAHLAVLGLPGRSSANAHRRRWLAPALLLVVFAGTLLPWQITAFRRIHAYNEEPPAPSGPTAQLMERLEQQLAGLSWDPAAEAAVAELPADVRRAMRNFVAATVFVRGRRAVGLDDLGILEEAFGTRPRPLNRTPFVALYGSLAFYLANNPQATGSFNRLPLDAPPPLAGGAERYPAFLVAGLPPAELSFSYPPHRQAITDGYHLGWRWIRSDPGAFLRLAWRKARLFWGGAAHGLTGWAVPGSLDHRRAVDLAVPAVTPAVAAWQLAVLAVALWGWSRWRPIRDSAPWLLFLASKLAACLLFFGYARFGAMVVPVVAVGVAAAIPASWLERMTGPPRARLAALTAGLLLVGVEAARWVERPVIEVDGRAIGARDAHLSDLHTDRRIRVGATER